MRSSSRADKANSEAQAAVDEYANGCICDAPAPVVAVPKQIVVPMLQFQQEGLAWMCQQEKTGTGGVLADEMGMGKTIQAISLLLARPLRGPTLVVCPMAACHQWVKEIERFTAKNSLRTLIYHGQHKSKVATEFRRVDVVVTTYQTLENEYRSETNKQRVTCKWCGKMFLPEKLTFHQRYFCGPTAIRTLKQQKTAKKDQVAAAKAMSTMGIGESVSGSAPTITNIYKEYMKEAGVDVKAKGYWNVVKETQERLGKGSSGKKSGPGLSRERWLGWAWKFFCFSLDKVGSDELFRSLGVSAKPKTSAPMCALKDVCSDGVLGSGHVSNNMWSQGHIDCRIRYTTTPPACLCCPSLQDHLHMQNGWLSLYWKVSVRGDLSFVRGFKDGSWLCVCGISTIVLR